MTDRPSLAYRNHKEAIRHGIIPEKYMRIVPHVPGANVLELGSAEGVLAACLARAGKRVSALELRLERHIEAVALLTHLVDIGWLSQEERDRVYLINGDLKLNLGLMGSADTIVAVRSIYYLRGSAETIFRHAGLVGVRHWVLCGNRNRAAAYAACEGKSDDPFMPYNYYASVEGMVGLLTSAGYHIKTIVPDGDPIVVGQLRA